MKKENLFFLNMTIILIVMLFIDLSIVKARRTRSSRVSPANAELNVERVGTDPYRMRVTLHVTAQGAWEVLADHRALSFEVTPSTTPSGRRRPKTLKCSYPHPMRRVDPEHVVQTVNGEATWSEEIDLRMYCWGKALVAIEAGAMVKPVYGFRRLSRRAWLVHSLDNNQSIGLANVTTQTSIQYEPLHPDLTENNRDLPVIEVGLRRSEATRPSRPILKTYITARGASVRLYLREDLWAFRVIDPNGQSHQCAVLRQNITPIVDFFQRVSQRKSIEQSIDTTYHCHDVFKYPGIYLVEPVLDLPYSGERFEINAITGQFVGRSNFIRINPARNAYVRLGT